MSTLADELLQDFEDSDSENVDAAEDDGGDDTAALMGFAAGDTAMDDLLSSDDEKDEDMKDTDQPGDAGAQDSRTEKPSGIRSAINLVKTLESVLEKIKFYQTQPAETRNEHVGNVEEHPEYHLLTQANSLSTSIDNEVVVVHKWIRDHYSVRFPELETLVTNPLEYAKTAAVLGNGPLDSETMRKMPRSTDNPLGVSLDAVLDKPTLMIVTTSAITSKGQAMPQSELDSVVAACETIVKLDEAKKTLTEYVQSRMSIFAPNLTALIGSLTAAQLLNTAGGLTGLSKTPACNLAAWGSKKGGNVSALATNVTSRQQGYLYQSPIIRTIPTDLKKQAMRIVSAKVVLAARVDRIHSAPDGSSGEEMKEQCLERLDKLQEKPLSKGAKALPAPDDKPSRKRGGRRARQAKAATAMTDLRKAQNRMAFGQEEKEVGYGDETEGLGMIGAAGDGRVRALQIDNRTRAKLSAKNKGWGGIATVAAGGAASSLRGGVGPAAGGLDLHGRGLRASGVGTTVGQGGTMSTLAFTPVQGLELVDPSVRAEMSRKRKAEEDRYFKGGTFTQVGGGQGGNGSSNTTNGTFKKPALPPAKRVDTGATKN